MIAEQTAVNTRTQNLVVHAPISCQGVAAIGTGLVRLARTLAAWASVPTLPYAALWEASLVANVVNDRMHYEADPDATDLPLLANSWLRG